MSAEIPELPVHATRKGGSGGASFVWLIPIVALCIALAVAWQSYANKGRLIEISFENGAGILANTTELKYRDISVGVVEDVTLSEGLKTVIASIRLDKKIEQYVDANAQFWIVRPELTTRGVSGLETVLSGVFIEGSWDGEPGEEASSFNGLSDAPLFRPGKPGLQIALRSAARGQLVDNSPILYRGIEVGRIGEASIDPRGNFAVAEAIIYDPHSRLITDSTRFWDTSGFSVSIGASGAAIDFSSVASLLSGGVTFDTFVSGGARVADGTLFQVFDGEETARSSVFNQSEVEELTVSVIFDDNISGLSVDSPVELSGLRIGSVASVTGIIDPEALGDTRVRLNAVLSIQPTRLGLPDEASPEAALAFLRTRSEQGLRARLATSSLLTGGLKVELIEVADAPAEPVRETSEGLVILPTTQSEISDASATVEGVLTRVNALPVEELLTSAIDFLNAASSFVSDEDLRETPEDLRRLMADISGVVASDDMQAMAGNLNKVLAQVETLLAALEREQTIQRLSTAVDAATQVAQGIDRSVAGLPVLITQLTDVATKAGDLPMEDLTQQLNDLARNANTLLSDDNLQATAGNLNAVLSQVTALFAQLENEQTVQRLTEAVASAASAVSRLDASAEGVPQLVAELTEVAAKANALPVEELTQRLSTLANSANTLLSDDGMQDLPTQLNAALAEINATLAELREGGAINNVNATLSSARNAADAVAVSTRDLPDLVDRLAQVLAQASNTIKGYDKGAVISRDAQSALRGVEQAADAITSLARTLERNPSALIRGR